MAAFCISYRVYRSVYLPPTNLYGMSNIVRLLPTPLIRILCPDISRAFLFGHLHTLHGSMSCSPSGERHLSGCPVVQSSSNVSCSHIIPPNVSVSFLAPSPLFQQSCQQINCDAYGEADIWMGFMGFI